MSRGVMKLAELASVKSGGGAPQNEADFCKDGIPFVRAGSLAKLLVNEAEDSLERLHPEVAKKHRLSLFPSGTVLFAKSGMSATKGYIYQLKKPAYVVNHLAALIPYENTDAAYIRHVLQFKSPTTLIKDEAYPSIRLGDIEEMLIPAPKEIRERERIAAILDQADSLRRARRRSIEKLNTLAQSIFYEMFGAFHDGYEGFEVCPIGDFIEDAKVGIVRGAKDMHIDAPIPYLRMDSIGADGSLRLLDLKRVDASPSELEIYSLKIGDFLFNTRNSKELVGKTAILRENFSGIYNNNILRCRFRGGLTGDFLDAFLRSQKGQASLNEIKSGTTSVFAIYQKSFFSLLVPIPPLDKQKEFSLRINSIFSNKNKFFVAMDAHDILFSSLQHRAFRGEL